jgi:hypothetical protein
VLQPEPGTFEARVRQPGRSFLRSNPRPTSEQFRKRNYWNRCLPDLRSAYEAICAYSSCWIPTQGTVDHFWPKTVKPELAYEWENYRFVAEKLNNYKGESQSVLDPFQIQIGWFVLNFDNFFVEPNQGLGQALENSVKTTISVLHLNDDDALVNFRFCIVQDYAKESLPFSFLRKRYPFIALELERQNLKEKIKERFQ